MREFPIFDTHNDLPWELRVLDPEGAVRRDGTLDLRKSRFGVAASLDTDFARARAGRLRGQAWSVWVPCHVNQFKLYFFFFSFF